MSLATILHAVPKVDIDSSGEFKYLLLKVYDTTKENVVEATIVRGYNRCRLHSEILEEVQQKLKPLTCEPLGGGVIVHDPERNKIHIYGESENFGAADHDTAAVILHDAYPLYRITYNYDETQYFLL